MTESKSNYQNRFDIYVLHMYILLFFFSLQTTQDVKGDENAGEGQKLN